MTDFTPENDSDNGFIERITVAGGNLVDVVKTIMEDKTVKRLTIRTKEGKELTTIPVDYGVIGGTMAVLIAPILSLVAFVGGAMAELTLEVERDADPNTPQDAPRF